MRKCFIIVLSVFGILVSGSSCSTDRLYRWEKNRYRAPEFADMVLCYGGSRHRTEYLWTKERFDSYVTYTDASGQEYWLFDAFLCLEFADLDTESGVKYSLMADQVNGPSGGKLSWERMLDYWFSAGNGLYALEASVSDAAKRLGVPEYKRRVIMFLPDPIPYLESKNPDSSHIYWGSLEGRQLDFLKDEDRLAAYKWYIDSARERFSKGKFKYIELVGFYVMSEILTIPSEPWTDNAKLHDLVPPLSRYLHSVNEYLYWIPFSQGAGWRRGRELGFDYVWMQPNHFWRGDDCPMYRFAGYLREEGVGMEFEFDTKVLESHPKHEMYRSRFREYMECAKREGVYGTQPLAYYVDSNCLRDLQLSSSKSDREFYREVCEFVINNPLRRKK